MLERMKQVNHNKVTLRNKSSFQIFVGLLKYLKIQSQMHVKDFLISLLRKGSEQHFKRQQ